MQLHLRPDIDHSTRGTSDKGGGRKEAVRKTGCHDTPSEKEPRRANHTNPEAKAQKKETRNSELVRLPQFPHQPKTTNLNEP